MPAATNDPTLLAVLLRRYPTAKRTTFRTMIRDGRVTVNGKMPRSLTAALGPDDRVEISDARPAPRVPARRSKASTGLAIVFEDDDVLVVDKPAGLLTSTVPGERRPTLLAAVREYVAAREPRTREPRPRVGLIHRLDRDASGLLVFSKSDAAYRSLKTQFFKHTVDRVYLALTTGVPNPKSGRVESWLEERADGTVYSIREPGKGERAVTHYEVVEHARKRALVRVRLETGRKHQIRVHLSERKAPIAGDGMYGSAGGAPRLMLAAVQLAFDHPRTGKRVVYELQPPEGFTVTAH